MQSLFQQCATLKLRVIPAGNAEGKVTHLSVQLYLVNNVQAGKLWFQERESERRDVEALIAELCSKARNPITGGVCIENQWYRFSSHCSTSSVQSQMMKKELYLKISHTILNQITYSKHYTVCKHNY